MTISLVCMTSLLDQIKKINSDINIKQTCVAQSKGFGKFSSSVLSIC
jgi:hypothetical protein